MSSIHRHPWAVSRIVAWAVLGLFLLGFFYGPVGIFTGAILGVWFVGTQKPLSGFLWLLAFAFVPTLLTDWRHLPLPPLEYSLWMLALAILTTLPFLFHRLVSPRLPGIASTLPLPLCGASVHALAHAFLPAAVREMFSPGHGRGPALDLVASTLGPGAVALIVYWFAAVLVWVWNHEFRRASVLTAAGGLLLVCGIAFGAAIAFGHSSTARALPLLADTPFAAACLGGAAILGAWAAFWPDNRVRPWAGRRQALDILESPAAHRSLSAVRRSDGESLVSASGERFPIRRGLPDFRTPGDLTGANRKYNHLYETIGGFYDDTQRVVSALIGMDRDAYVMSYLGKLEVKPGDSVLETSVGTGLNYKYLPRGTRLFGLDLSAEMLARCQANLRRWQLDADLVLGNAESLPFADRSFDVVFHVGGINFFNDRAAAIREMIRVAKPGSLILIADETEEHVKSAYERFPITGQYFKHREKSVVAPVDLVPMEMEEVRLELLDVGGKNRFYVLTFRKPALEAGQLDALSKTAALAASH